MEVVKEPTAGPAEQGLVPAKLAGMAILGGSAFVCTLLPVFLARKCTAQGHWINYLLRFGGGILLATTFLHLLPEVREGMEKLEDDVTWLKTFPVQVPELLMCLGFFIMYGVEEFAHKLLGHSHGPDSEKAVLHDEHAELNNVWSDGTPLRAILITVAISVHQLFEGLAVGLETHTSQVWILTGAISAHKVVISLCVGAEISKAKKCGATVLVSVFTIATPLGIALGLALTSQGTAMGLVSVILQGLACGTLLYVVFFEVLSKQEGAAASLAQFAITAFGFAVMLVLLYAFES